MGRHHLISILTAWGLCAAAMTWPTSDALGKDINVPTDAASIQAAINLSNQSTEASDVIHVASGTYTENLAISKPASVPSKSLAIRADDGAKVVLQAASSGTPLIEIRGGATATLERLILVTAGRGVVLGAGVATVRNLVITLASTAIECSTTTTGSTIEQVTFFQVTNGINCPTSLITIKNNIFSNVSSTPITAFSVSGPIIPTFNLFFQSGTAGVRGDPEAQLPNGDRDPKFVDEANNDFHLREGSAAQGTGQSNVDVGAYGGDFGSTIPFPPSKPSIGNCTTTVPLACTVTWPRNLDYLVTGYVVLSSGPLAPSPAYDTTTPLDNAAAACAGSATDCSVTLSPLTDFSANPDPPGTPTAAVGSAKVLLGWSVPASGATFYEVVAELGSGAATPSTTTPARTSPTPGAMIDRLSDGTPLINGTSYDFWVRSGTQPKLYAVVEAVYGTVSATGKVSEQSEPAAAAPYGSPRFSATYSGKVTATPDVPDPFPRLEDTGGCFIATAAYGSAMAPQVDVLRAFRERYLRPYVLGRAFIHRYELWSPPLADAIRGSESGRLIVRIVLWPVVGLAWLAVQWPLALVLVLIAGVGGTLIWGVRGRMRGTTRA